MKQKFLALILLSFSISLLAQPQKVAIENTEKGMKLMVNNQSFMVNGMNWDYFPIGTKIGRAHV